MNIIHVKGSYVRLCSPQLQKSLASSLPAVLISEELLANSNTVSQELA